MINNYVKGNNGLNSYWSASVEQKVLIDAQSMNNILNGEITFVPIEYIAPTLDTNVSVRVSKAGSIIVETGYNKVLPTQDWINPTKKYLSISHFFKVAKNYRQLMLIDKEEKFILKTDITDLQFIWNWGWSQI